MKKSATSATSATLTALVVLLPAMGMIGTVATLAMLSAVTASSAIAQSGVTAYGVIDTIVRHTNNEIKADGTPGSNTQLEQGIFQGPRLGFKGEQGLGGDGGTAAVFQLEMGLKSDTGESDQQGQLFGRQAFVGLKNDTWGEIDVGRQYGVAFNLLGNYDPLGMGNLPENAWQLFLIGVRFDNSLKYTNSWGPVSAEVQYSFGEQTGSTSRGSTTGLGLTYEQGPFNVGVFNQRSTDANSNKVNIAGIGASLELQQVVFYSNYFSARRDAGFAITPGSGAALANTSMLGNATNTLQRKDDVFTVGLLYNATPTLSYTLGYMIDSVKNETSAGNSGKLSTIYAVADYDLSKRTDVYVSFDYTKVDGSEIEASPSSNSVLHFAGAGMGSATNRTGISIGLRTKF